MKKLLSLVIAICLALEQPVFAQVAPHAFMPANARLVDIPDKYHPVHLRSIANNHGGIDIVADKGDFPSQAIDPEIARVVSYFQIALRLPNETFWVNLRPDGQDTMIDPLLESTDVGRIFLETDVQLKKDFASSTSPNTPEGAKYWTELYRRAESLFGASRIEIPTISRPWIVPGEVLVRETGEGAYVYKAMLKVRLEQDHLAGTASYAFKDERLKALNEFAAGLLRELVVPKLELMVNGSKQYAAFRQVYYSLILAQWFKKKFANLPGEYSSRIDCKDLTGLTSKTTWNKGDYFKAYRDSFRNGEYNLTKIKYDTYGQSIRRYASGGAEMVTIAFDVIQGLDGGLLPGGELPGYLVGRSVEDGKIIAQKDGGLFSREKPRLSLPTADERLLRANGINIVSVEASNDDRFPRHKLSILTARGSDRYDCIAWSIGRDDIRVGEINHLPFYTRRGFIPVQSIDEADIAVYGVNGRALHAAVHIAGKWWESKMGGSSGPRIAHSLEEIEGGMYGNVIALYKSPGSPDGGAGAAVKQPQAAVSGNAEVWRKRMTEWDAYFRDMRDHIRYAPEHRKLRYIEQLQTAAEDEIKRISEQEEPGVYKKFPYRPRPWHQGLETYARPRWPGTVNNYFYHGTTLGALMYYSLRGEMSFSRDVLFQREEGDEDYLYFSSPSLIGGDEDFAHMMEQVGGFSVRATRPARALALYLALRYAWERDGLSKKAAFPPIEYFTQKAIIRVPKTNLAGGLGEKGYAEYLAREAVPLFGDTFEVLLDQDVPLPEWSPLETIYLSNRDPERWDDENSDLSGSNYRSALERSLSVKQRTVSMGNSVVNKWISLNKMLLRAGSTPLPEELSHGVTGDDMFSSLTVPGSLRDSLSGPDIIARLKEIPFMSALMVKRSMTGAESIEARAGLLLEAFGSASEDLRGLMEKLKIDKGFFRLFLVLCGAGPSLRQSLKSERSDVELAYALIESVGRKLGFGSREIGTAKFILLHAGAMIDPLRDDYGTYIEQERRAYDFILQLRERADGLGIAARDLFELLILCESIDLFNGKRKYSERIGQGFNTQIPIIRQVVADESLGYREYLPKRKHDFGWDGVNYSQFYVLERAQGQARKFILVFDYSISLAHSSFYGTRAVDIGDDESTAREVVALVESSRVREEMAKRALRRDADAVAAVLRENLKSGYTIRGITSMHDLEKDGGARNDGMSANPQDGKGGIDMRSVPMNIETSRGSPNTQVTDGGAADLAQLWSQIEKRLSRGQMPFARMKEYVNCCKRQNAGQQLRLISESIAAILRLEEERCIATTPEIRELLSLMG